MSERIIPFNPEELSKKYASSEDSSNAEKIFNAASKNTTNPRHTAYFEKKGLKVTDIPAARFGDYYKTPALLIPIKDINGKVQSVQYIFQDLESKTQKRFLKGVDKLGCFLEMDSLNGCDHIFITEGIATAASLKKILSSCEIYKSSGVVCAFSAQGIPKVAKLLKETFVYAEVIAAPDSDQAGSAAAKKCREIGFGAIFPPQIKKGADWNDIYIEKGIKEGFDVFAESMATMLFLETESIKDLETILEKIDEDPCKGLSMEHFPPVLRTYVESLCETTEAHPIMIIMSVLCSISAMVSKRVYMPRGEYFQNLYPNIWSLCITKSGGFKTTALNKGSEIALEEDRKILDTMNDLKHKENPNFDLLEDDSKFSDAVKREILIESLRRPLLPTRITTEFLIKHLSQGHQGMILSSELGEWLGNMQKQHNVDLKQIFTYFYDVDIAPYEHRTKHCGNYIVRQPFVTINGVSTVDWIESQVKADDVFSGFFARILLFAPPFESKIPDALPREIISLKDAKGKEAKRKIAETLRYLGELKFTFSKEAKVQFRNIHEALYQMVRQSKYDERCQRFLEPYLKRWSPYVLKLAMLFRILEDPLSQELSVSSIKASTELIRVAIRSTAKLFEKELGESEDQRKQRKVYEWIVKRSSENKKAPYFALIKSRILDGGSKEYDEVLETLENAGKIECLNPKTENKKDYEYVPTS